MTLEVENVEESSVTAQTRKLCLALQNDNKRVRKQALIDFEAYLKTLSQADNNAGADGEGKHHEVFNQCHIQLFNTLRDKAEPVREQSVHFIKFFIVDTLPTNDYYLSYLFPVLVERIGTVEIVEESEEIRLLLLQLMQAIIDKYSNKGALLKPFLGDFITILGETVKDKFAEIKQCSCKCIIALAQVLPRDFHLQSESLVKPVLTTFMHQRYKIRVEGIKAMGEIVMHSSYKALEEVVGPLAERLFDQIPTVRRTIAQVAARWLMEYRDRYSFFHRLLPLILTGLNDEVSETREEALQLWLAVGLQYQNENEKEFKDQMDYLYTEPKYYPPNLTRPNLGCRMLVQRNVSKLTSALAKELVSWQADVRVRCSQLLCSVAHHAEAGVTQNLQDLLLAMYTAARDEDERVVVNVIRASELFGMFVPADAWRKLILPVIEAGPHHGHFIVLAGFIRGAPQEYVGSSLREISQVLADKSIVYSRKAKYQQELLTCARAIESKYDDELSDDIGQFLFNIIATLLSIKSDDDDKIKASELDELQAVLKLPDQNALWRKYLSKLLAMINTEPITWTELTIERCVFDLILTHSGTAFGLNLDTIGDILSNCLNIDVEAESRLKTFMALTSAFDMKDRLLQDIDKQALEGFLSQLVKDVLVPSLVWHAGRTAEAMRTMAAYCLCSALSPGVDVDLFTKDVLIQTFQQLQPLLISLAEDASHRSRELAVENLVLLKQALLDKNAWTLDDLVKIYPEILKRLDDPTDKVRISSIKALLIIFDKTPEEFNQVTYKAHHDLILDTLFTHFDDEDTSISNVIGDVLKKFVVINQPMLEDKVRKHRELIRNQSGCEELEKYLGSLKIY